MVKKFSVEGFDNFKAKAEELAKEGPLYVLFSGSKNEKGESWCPDCVVAYPIVQKCLEEVDDDSSFLYVEVGDRAFWKDPNCIFRTAPETRLNSVPTLMMWGSPRRLEEDKCADPGLVSMLFED
uniref:Thioredoxin domain-containing protein 17 n=1 Tax=Acartia pacifica TaxID=335913 RepID=A0A0U2IG67_ACAPC|nr:thioredoxin domain-containing protein 17-like protein [Acartia pacifica]